MLRTLISYYFYKSTSNTSRYLLNFEGQFVQQVNNTRIHYLDAMRGILMILGIVIHAAQIYSPEAVLKVVNPHTSVVMHYVVDSIHLFRMPAFFVVSGFFCYLTLEKYGVSRFLKLRLARIAIPLITTIFTLNLTMYYLLVNTGWIGGGYAVGKRIDILTTRKIILAITSNLLKNISKEIDPSFGLKVPFEVPGVEKRLLSPRSLWEKEDLYDNEAKKVRQMFIENFKQFKSFVDKDVNNVVEKLKSF